MPWEMMMSCTYARISHLLLAEPLQNVKLFHVLDFIVHINTNTDVLQHASEIKFDQES